MEEQIELISRKVNGREIQESKILGNVTTEIKELNGEYVKIKVIVENDNESRGYGIIINNELVAVSANNEIIANNLNCGSSYNIEGCAFDKNINVKKSEKQLISMLDHQYVYKDGNEFQIFTGGIAAEAYQGNTSTTVVTKSTSLINVTDNPSSNGYVTIALNKNGIDLSKYSKIGIETDEISNGARYIRSETASEYKATDVNMTDTISSGTIFLENIPNKTDSYMTITIGTSTTLKNINIKKIWLEK